MPDGGATVISWLGAEIGGEIGATMVMYATEIATAAAVVSSVYTLREAQRKAQNRARDQYNASLRDRYVMVRGAAEARQVVLGRQRVSGPIAFIKSTGTDRTTLAFVVLLAAHEIDAVEKIYIDDELATLDAYGNVVAVQRQDQFAISTATATVDIASEPKSGTVTASVAYGSTVVSLTVTGVTGTSVSVSGATAGVTGTLTITYQPATSPWVSGTPGDEALDVITLDGSGNASNTLSHAPVAGSVHAVASTGTGQDRVDTDMAPYMTVVGSSITIASAPTPGQSVSITYRVSPTSGSIWTTLGAAMGNTTSRMRIAAHLGTAGQAAEGELISLFPGIWTSSHKLVDQAYLFVECAYDPDAFPSGLPNISAVVRGAKLYDPRSATTVWSENPALMVRYVATSALLGRQATSAVNDTNIAAQATVCDASVAYVVDGQTYTRAKYTAGMVIKSGTRPADAITDLCNAMAGKWCVVDGALRVRAGASVTALQTLDETWLAGAIDSQDSGIEIQAQVPRADVFNTATGKFADGSRDYQELDYPAVRSSTYISDDGAELPLEISLPAVTFSGQAQQVVATMMRDARMGLRVTLTCNMRAFAVEPFDVLQVTLGRFGWSAKLFEVLDVQWAVGGGIQLVLKETDPSIWALGTSFSAVPLSPPTLLPSPWYVPAVAGLAAYSGSGEFQTMADGTVVGTMRVTWTAITDLYVNEAGGGVEVRYGPATDAESTWRTVQAPQGSTSIRLADVHDGRLYLVKARAFTAMTKGAWCPVIMHQVVAKASAPSNVSGFSVSAQPGGVAVSWTPSTEADYAETEVRYGGSWAGGTRIYKGRGESFVWPWPSAGSYTLRARHRNTSGVESASDATGSVSVGTNTLIDSAQINVGAATDVYLDSYDYAFSSISGGERSFTYTPTTDCTIEFTAKCSATQVYPDGGHYLRWYVQAGSGSDVLLGGAVTTSTAKQDFACVSSFSATGGVTLTFKLRTEVPFGDPAITVGVTNMRVTAILR